MSNCVGKYLGKRCKVKGCQYSVIPLSMLGYFSCGGNRTEDITL